MTVQVLTSDELPAPSSRLWLIAGAFALLLHAGCVLFLFAEREDDDVAFGAPALAIDVDLAAPTREPSELPPGPDSEASTAAPPVVEQKEILKQSDLPKDTPTEADDPARLVAPDAAKKPVDDDPNVKAVQATPSTESVAAEATAAPSSENVAEAKRSTAPVQGIGESTRLVRATWEKELSILFNKHKRYPQGRPAHKADVEVKFEIDRLGHLLSSGVTRSSGDAAFDEAALAMLKRSDPMPPPPPVVADNGLSFTIVVNFKGPK